MHESQWLYSQEINICLAALLLLAVVDCSASSANSGVTIGWHSQVFIVPNMMTPKGLKCAEKRVSFCLDSFRLETSQSGREAHLTDAVTFEQLIRHNFHLFNWFSLQGNESCCSSQVNAYINFGQRFQVSPEDYMKKATEFASGYKPVNWIRALYDARVCRNIIVEIGFGGGGLRITGAYHPAKDYTLQVANVDHAVTFPAKRLKSQLTFHWFKHNVVCISQPWICESPHARYYNY